MKVYLNIYMVDARYDFSSYIFPAVVCRPFVAFSVRISFHFLYGRVSSMARGGAIIIIVSTRSPLSFYPFLLLFFNILSFLIANQRQHHTHTLFVARPSSGPYNRIQSNSCARSVANHEPTNCIPVLFLKYT